MRTLLIVLLSGMALSVSAQQSTVKEVFKNEGKTFVLSTISEQKLDASMGEWLPGSKYTHTYDDNNNLVCRDVTHWVPEGEFYTEGNRSDYTYDNKGRLTAFDYYCNIQFEQDQEPIWIYMQTEKYCYTGESTQIDSTLWIFPSEIEGDDPYVCGKMEHFYDDNGQQFKNVYHAKYSVDGKWNLSQKNEYSEPCATGQYTKRRQDLYILDAISNSGVERYTYNEKGLKIQSDGYQLVEDEEIIKSRNVFTYSPEGLVETEDVSYDFGGTGEPSKYMSLKYYFDPVNKYTTKKEVYNYSANVPDGEKVSENEYIWLDKTVTGIESHNLTADVKVQVNNSVITVEYDGKVSNITLYDLAGHIMTKMNSTQGNAKKLDASRLAGTGCYVVVVNYDNGTQKTKIVL